MSGATCARGAIAPVVLIAAVLAGPLEASDPLFPKPMHLTREVEEPLSGSITRIEEYCIGNRVISILGAKTSIADYDRGELTEIDRVAGTFSITRFEQIAAAHGVDGSRDKSRRMPTLELTSRGVRGVAARSGEVFESEVQEFGAGRTVVEVVVDRSVRLSGDAIEVLTGAAWPAQRGVESEIAIRAAEAAGDAEKSPRSDYGLPLEQVVTFEVEGETLRKVNRVIRVGTELPSPGLMAIPPGAREVPSPIIERERILKELDRLSETTP